jgi:uncharacterized pyridoxal phosphate-containing UPF0001 family protein
MSIADNINNLKSQTTGQNVTLVAVSKTKTVAEVMEAYQAGGNAFSAKIWCRNLLKNMNNYQPT